MTEPSPEEAPDRTARPLAAMRTAQGRILRVLPHIDVVTDTSPPWTVPTTPDYALDPHPEFPATGGHLQSGTAA
jgi:hypothetical protein